MERLIISTGIGSRAAARLERYTKQVTAIRSPLANAVIAAAIASALAIAPPTLAASGSGSGGPVGGPGSVGQKDAAVSPAKTSHAKATGGHRVSGASSSGPSSPVRAEGWYRGSAPPGRTGHGEQRGGDGKKMPPGLSHRDHYHDREWGDRRLSRDAEKGDREHAQLNTGQPERRVDW